MEVIRAIIGIIIGVMVLTLVFKLAWPILVFIFVVTTISAVRLWFLSRKGQNRAAYTARPKYNQNGKGQTNQSAYRTNQSSNPGASDVIDAEFTEEEIID